MIHGTIFVSVTGSAGDSFRGLISSGLKNRTEAESIKNDIAVGTAMIRRNCQTVIFAREYK
jgi:hypothetical protein